MLIFVTKKTNSEELAKNLREKGHERKYSYSTDELYVSPKHKIMQLL